MPSDRCQDFRLHSSIIELNEHVAASHLRRQPDLASWSKPLGRGPPLTHHRAFRSPLPSSSVAIPSAQISQFPATIFPGTPLSFTTDNQLPWLSEGPPSPSLQTQSQAQAPEHFPASTDYSVFPPTADFELFPTTPAQQSAQPTTQGTASIHHPVRDFQGHGHPPAQAANLYSVSRPQELSTRSPSTSVSAPKFTLAATAAAHRQRQFYAASAPSSSTALSQQQQQQHQEQPQQPQIDQQGLATSSASRPPVPLFHPHHSTGSVPTERPAQYSPMDQGPGNLSHGTLPSSSSVTSIVVAASKGAELTQYFDIAMMDNIFDFSLGQYGLEEGGDVVVSPSQPAAPPLDDGSNVQQAPFTVSPSELVIDPHASAPPSGAMTNMTSPSIFDTPEFVQSLETSPVFAGNVGSGRNSWYSLFPAGHGVIDESPLQPVADDDLLQCLDPAQGPQADVHADPRSRSGSRSSQLDSPLPRRPSASVVRHSTVAGVNSRRRDKPLPPITVNDPSDTVAMKRARNTLAARKSRQKKTERFEELEREIEELRNERNHWKDLATRLRAGLAE